jgi:pilus assembly protein CpaB
MDDQNGRFRPNRAPRGSGLGAFLFWVVALTAGGGAAYLIHSYVKTNMRSATPNLKQVAVAAKNLDLATTLQADHIQMVPWPESLVSPEAILDPKDAIGRVLISRLVKGQMLLEAMLASRESGQGLAALIPPNMRAVAVSVDDIVGVAGFIHPDDRVDVIVTFSANSGARRDLGEATSKVILQNVTVLTVGKEIEVKDNARNKPLSVTVATLLVSPEDSEKLALAANQGKLLLSLRGRSDSERPSTPGMVASVLLGDLRARPSQSEMPSIPQAAPAREPRPKPHPVQPRPADETAAKVEKKQTVEILRGDRFEQRKFDTKENP